MKNFWTQKYQNNQTGWDLGKVSNPIKEYIDQLKNKKLKILIPGAGNSYEAEYLHNNGFTNVTVMDISENPLENIQKRIPTFPKEKLICCDFFDQKDTFDIIIEQTFFCAINPSLREKYVAKMYESLNENGKIIGVMFCVPKYTDHPPYGGNMEEYRNLFSSKFEIKTIENCKNSEESRAGQEVFINFIKK